MANVGPGDLARVVAPYAQPGRGAFVKVARDFCGMHVFNGVLYASGERLCWVVEGWVRNDTGRACGPELVICDECLRRVDPGDAEDEILRLVGKPQPTVTPAPVEA